MAIVSTVTLAVQLHNTRILSVVYAEAGRALAACLASEALEAHALAAVRVAHAVRRRLERRAVARCAAARVDRAQVEVAGRTRITRAAHCVRLADCHIARCNAL